jgi:hypothetical protein
MLMCCWCYAQVHTGARQRGPTPVCAQHEVLKTVSAQQRQMWGSQHTSRPPRVPSMPCASFYAPHCIHMHRTASICTALHPWSPRPPSSRAAAHENPAPAGNAALCPIVAIENTAFRTCCTGHLRAPSTSPVGPRFASLGSHCAGCRDSRTHHTGAWVATGPAQMPSSHRMRGGTECAAGSAFCADRHARRAGRGRARSPVHWMHAVVWRCRRAAVEGLAVQARRVRCVPAHTNAGRESAASRGAMSSPRDPHPCTATWSAWGGGAGSRRGAARAHAHAANLPPLT